jgi:hypothetical protein
LAGQRRRRGLHLRFFRRHDSELEPSSWEAFAGRFLGSVGLLFFFLTKTFRKSLPFREKSQNQKKKQRTKMPPDPLPGSPATWESIEVVGSHMQSTVSCWGVRCESTFVIFETKEEAKHADLGAPIRCAVCETLKPNIPIFGLKHDDPPDTPIRVSNNKGTLEFHRVWYYPDKEIFDVVAREFSAVLEKVRLSYA